MIKTLAELRFRSSRGTYFYCRWDGEGDDATQADVSQVIKMLELMRDTFPVALAPAEPAAEGE